MNANFDGRVALASLVAASMASTSTTTKFILVILAHSQLQLQTVALERIRAPLQTNVF